MSALTYVARGGRAASAACPTRLPFVPDRRGAAGVVVRQPGHAGQRRRDGAQRPLHAEGRRAARRGGDRRRAQRGRRRHRPRRACWSCSSRGRAEQLGAAFPIPSSSKLLVVIAVVLARRRHGRWRRGGAASSCSPRRARRCAQSWRASMSLARSPSRLAALFGGSVGVTLAYIAALACADRRVRRRHQLRPGRRGVPRRVADRRRRADAGRPRRDRGGARRRVHRRRAWTRRSPSPRCSATACVTYWLPILPGWLSFHLLERRNYI